MWTTSGQRLLRYGCSVFVFFVSFRKKKARRLAVRSARAKASDFEKFKARHARKVRATVAAGAVVIQAPTKQPWAYEMKIADPDGNTLWLGTDG